MMEKKQEIEWENAQKIAFSVNLVDAAKKQLEFLAAVDRNRHLNDGPTLQWAIFRNNAFWLPLLAKHSKNTLSEEPLVVPLDCEWIWHCHRLNPVRYKLDCEKLFGRILDNDNVISSVQGISKDKTKEIWKIMYPEEPYELELNKSISRDILLGSYQNERFTNYDLVSAVTRQIPFTFQVSRPHMSYDLFLQEAVVRYKGFVHLIRTNKRKNIRRFCVPTIDIDLIWHSHQLHPASYCKDLIKIVGEVVGHNDNVSDQTKRKKLENGFSEFTKQWEETFGLRYWKAGAMYRGATPTPVTHIPFSFNSDGKKNEPISNYENLTRYPVVKAVEVLLEFVKIKNMPKADKENLFISFSKKQPDKLFNTKRTLSIFSECGEKNVASFKCEPTGEFLFELISHLPSSIPELQSFKLLGSCFFSLEELFSSKVQLSVDKWLSVVPITGVASYHPVLHISISFTIPTPVDQVYHLVHSPKRSKYLHANSWTRIIDDTGNHIICLQMRSLSEEINAPDSLNEIQYIKDPGETHTLARFVGNEWCLEGTYGSFKLHRSFGNNGDMFELVGDKMVKLFSGRRLDFEIKYCAKQRNDQDFVTVVEFSSQHPYGRAIALIDLTFGTLKVKDEWMILLGITLTFILYDTLKRQGYNAFTKRGNMDCMIDQLRVVARNRESEMETKDEMIKSATCVAGDISVIDQVTNLARNTKNKMESNEEMICARCLAGVSCGHIDQVRTLAKNINSKIDIEEHMMKNARCYCLAKSAVCDTGGTCGSGGCDNPITVKTGFYGTGGGCAGIGGCGNHFTVKSEACGGGSCSIGGAVNSEADCGVGCYGTKCKVSSNDYIGDNFHAGSSCAKCITRCGVDDSVAP